jgi:hypothetical protein
MSSPVEDAPRRTPTNQDFVVREGFPALRKPDGSGPWLEGVEPPLPAGPVAIYSSVLTVKDEKEAQVWESLWQDCRTVFSARTREDHQAYSAGVTYFWPSVMKPRCALEEIVQAIFRSHTAVLTKDSSKAMLAEQSGAEWWTLVLDDDEKAMTVDATKASAKTKDGDTNGDNDNKDDDEEEEEDESDEVGLHFDADYGLEDQVTNLFVHPRVATVTYLSNAGAPTVVLDRKSPPQGKLETLNGPIQQGWLCHPVMGRHLAFDGRLLHGAPATFFPAAPTKAAAAPPSKKPKLTAHETPRTLQRITLLVNVWVNHCPLDAEPLDEEICEKLQTPLGAMQWTESLPPSEDIKDSVHLKASEDDPAGEEEGVIGDRIVTAHYGPSMEDLHEASGAGSLVALAFDKGALQLVVGGPAPEDEDDEDQDDK